MVKTGLVGVSALGESWGATPATLVAASAVRRVQSCTGRSAWSVLGRLVRWRSQAGHASPRLQGSRPVAAPEDPWRPRKRWEQAWVYLAGETWWSTAEDWQMKVAAELGRTFLLLGGRVRGNRKNVIVSRSGPPPPSLRASVAGASAIWGHRCLPPARILCGTPNEREFVGLFQTPLVGRRSTILKVTCAEMLACGGLACCEASASRRRLCMAYGNAASWPHSA